MFLQVSVCPEGRSLYDVTSCLAAWSHVPSGGFSVPGPMFLPAGLCLGGLCPGGRCLGWGSLSGRPPCMVKSGWYTSYWNAFLLNSKIVYVLRLTSFNFNKFAKDSKSGMDSIQYHSLDHVARKCDNTWSCPKSKTLFLATSFVAQFWSDVPSVVEIKTSIAIFLVKDEFLAKLVMLTFRPRFCFNVSIILYFDTCIWHKFVNLKVGIRNLSKIVRIMNVFGFILIAQANPLPR